MQVFGRRLTIYNPLDFEAGALTDWQRLQAVHDYLGFVTRSSANEMTRQETGFAQECCAALLRRGKNRGKALPLSTVRAQVARAVRVAKRYEGRLNRVVRRYWWVLAVCLLVALFTLGSTHYDPDWVAGPPSTLTW